MAGMPARPLAKQCDLPRGAVRSWDNTSQKREALRGEAVEACSQAADLSNQLKEKLDWLENLCAAQTSSAQPSGVRKARGG